MSSSKSNRRLVLIDPDPETRAIFAQRLRAHGYVVDDAPDACTGAEMALADPPAAIVCDLWMQGISGVQLCRLLCAEPATASVPVVLRSDVDDPRSRFWSRHAGARALVAKGRMGELVRALEDVLENTPEQDAFFFHLSGAHDDIRDRVAEHLDRALFASVVAGEVRALSNATTFERMFDSLTQLLTQLVDYRWLALSTTGTSNVFAVHAHRRQFEAAEAEAVRILLPGSTPGRVVRIQDDDARDVDAIERTVVCDLMLAGVRLGQMAFGVPAGPTHIDKLAPAIAPELATVVRLVSLVEESQRLATTDGLTGLTNRRAFVQQLQREIARSSRTASPTSLLLLDLDHFKQINDTHGHGAGDNVLCAVAKTLQREARCYDLVGRWGGEEFVVALPNTTEENGLLVAERLRLAISSIRITSEAGVPISLSASIGAVQLEGGEPLDTLVDRADRAMYSAKVGGRNRVCSSNNSASAAAAVAA